MNNTFAAFLLVIAAAVIIGLIISLPIMWLWNVALVPAVTILKPIGWLQAWGITILCGLLFNTKVETK